MKRLLAPHARRERVPVGLRRPRAVEMPRERAVRLRACRAAGSASAMCRANRRSDLFGGNSNWRGPIWMPVNYLLIESLRRFHRYYGDDFKVECPTGSGRFMNLDEVATELSRRLSRLFLKDETAGGRCSANRRAAPERSGVSRPRAVLRVFRRRYRPRHRRLAPDRLDRAGRAAAGGCGARYGASGRTRTGGGGGMTCCAGAGISPVDRRGCVRATAAAVAASRRFGPLRQTPTTSRALGSHG